MPSFQEARSIILESIAPVGTEKVMLLEAMGRVLAEEVNAVWDMPRWDNSAMDGYAVRSEDCIGPATLKISGYLPAGAVAGPSVASGCAIKIMTGAPLPPGADAVVPYEETTEEGDSVLIHESVKHGQHIRCKGEDISSGKSVVLPGTIIGPPEISMFASFGLAFVKVYRKPRVAILSTGDELIELGSTPEQGQIINSNALSLAAAVIELGGDPLLLGIAKDTKDSHLEKMKEGLQADALITSAGVSSGDRDLVRETLAELGVRQLFWKVDIKPGRPLAFGVKEQKPVFSLPGNPVSTMVTFEQFVRPALLKMMGQKRIIKPLIQATLMEEVRKKPGRLHFLRVVLTKIDQGYQASSSGDQNTGILTSMIAANGLALLPAEKSIFAAGEQVQVHILNRHFEMLEG
jgi:molybdopterin molybdotransferase